MPLAKDMQHWTDLKKSTSPDGQGTYKPIAARGEVNQGYLSRPSGRLGNCLDFWRMTRTTRGAGGLCFGWGIGIGFGCRSTLDCTSIIVGFRSSFIRLGALRRRLLASIVATGVPTAARQHESSSGDFATHDLGQAAFRTIMGHGRGKALESFFFRAAGFTAVLVEWHGILPNKRLAPQTDSLTRTRHEHSPSILS